jgi:MerR family transcriptional regulator, copper efflux regulator
LKIHELAQKTGLSVHTIRFYEKQGLLDSRQVVRENNQYRNYSDEAIERLKLVKKFQGVGCSLDEVKEILQAKDDRTVSNQQVIEWIRHKITEIEQKRDEYDQILDTLHWMLDYRIALDSDPEKAESLITPPHSM